MLRWVKFQTVKSLQCSSGRSTYSCCLRLALSNNVTLRLCQAEPHEHNCLQCAWHHNLVPRLRFYLRLGFFFFFSLTHSLRHVHEPAARMGTLPVDIQCWLVCLTFGQALIQNWPSVIYMFLMDFFSQENIYAVLCLYWDVPICWNMSKMFVCLNCFKDIMLDLCQIW